ncbi:MAG: SMI1/KNR4 family protein [Pseudomonadota bacterium]
MNDLIERGVSFTDGDIETIETAIERTLPEALSNFLLDYGDAFVGGNVDGDDLFEVLGFHSRTDIAKNIFTYEDLIADKAWPFARDSLGNICPRMES